MVAVADASMGINDGIGPRKIRATSEIQQRMFDVDAALKPVMLPPGLGELNDALSRQTSHVPPRKIRHEHFFDLLTLPQESWEDRWKQLNATHVG
jgi:hypothetical protein